MSTLKDCLLGTEKPKCSEAPTSAGVYSSVFDTEFHFHQPRDEEDDLAQDDDEFDEDDFKYDDEEEDGKENTVPFTNVDKKKAAKEDDKAELIVCEITGIDTDTKSELREEDGEIVYCDCDWCNALPTRDSIKKKKSSGQTKKAVTSSKATAATSKNVTNKPPAIDWDGRPNICIGYTAGKTRCGSKATRNGYCGKAPHVYNDKADMVAGTRSSSKRGAGR